MKKTKIWLYTKRFIAVMLFAVILTVTPLEEQIMYATEVETEAVSEALVEIGKTELSVQETEENAGKEQKETEESLSIESSLAENASMEYEKTEDTPSESFLTKTEGEIEKKADIASGTYGNITWVIDADGKLTVTGSGEFSGEAGGAGYVRAPWHENSEFIISAEVSVKGITDLSWMFNGCKNLTSVNWNGLDTSNVTDMQSMFWNCSSLTSVDVRGFDTEKVTNMSYMFYNCSGLTSVDVSGFDTENVTNMGDMFKGCKSLTSVDVSGFDTGNVTNMRGMFDGCSGLTSVDVSGFDTGNVTDMGYMFSGCSGLTSVNVRGFDTGNVTDMIAMFQQCSLTSVDVRGFDTGNVTDMGYMFSHCNRLTSLDLSSFDLRNVNSASSMLYGCSNLTTIQTPKNAALEILLPVKTGYSWHYNESEVTSLPQNLRSSVEITRSENSTSDDDIASGTYNNITWVIDSNGKLIVEGKGDFAPLSSNTLEDYERAPWHEYRNMVQSAEINVKSMLDASYMFYGCKNMKSMDLSGFDTKRVSDMSNMFSGCSSLTSLDLSSFNTCEVTSMHGMFDGCSSITRLDLSSFDTSHVFSMSWMFYGCSALTNLDLSSFDTRELMSMLAMFDGCENLVSLDMSSFDGGRVSELAIDGEAVIFDGCNNLNTIYTPYNLRGSYSLPMNLGDNWYQSDGIIVTKLPRLGDSMVIMKNKIPAISNPYITATIRKTNYFCGDFINSKDLTVKCYNSDGTIKKVTDYTTNKDEIDMSTPGSRTLIIQYNNMVAEVKLTVSMVPVKSIELDKNILTLSIGETAELKAEIIPSNVVNTAITWSSSNRFIAQVKQDIVKNDMVTVTPVARGKCTIMALVGDKTAVCNVFVTTGRSGDDIAGGNYKNVRWIINRYGKLIVEGIGDFADFGLTAAPPWLDKRDDIKSAEIDLEGTVNCDKMFYECKNIESVDLSNFDASEVISMEQVFSGCSSLGTINTPRNLKVSVSLPSGNWYDSQGNKYTELPKSLADSILLTKENDSFEPIEPDNPTEITEYRVTTTEELMNAIGSYRHIILADGVYEIIETINVKDSGKLQLSNLVSLSLEAEHSGKAEILCRLNPADLEAGYVGCSEPVIVIDTSKDIKIKGCILGHDGRIGGCNSSAYVVSIYKSQDVEINNCDLYGCGSVGVACRDSDDIVVNNCVVRDCVFHIASGSNVNGLCFKNCILSGHIGHTHGDYYYAALSCDGDISFENCKFLNNQNPTFDDYKSAIINCEFYNNVWDGGTPQASGICLNGITWQVDGTTLKLGYPLQLDANTIKQSKKGNVLDYSDSSLPWKGYNIKKVDTAEGIGYGGNLVPPQIEQSYITVQKQKRFYVCGEILNVDDLTVQYHNADGTVINFIGYTTNADTIDMSVPGIKTLIVTYNGLTAEIQLAVRDKNVANSYTVIFDTQNYGTAPEAYTNVETGTTIQAPQAPTAEGYRFLGWYKEADCKTLWDFELDTIEGDTILYAGWEPEGGQDNPSENIPDGIWIADIKDCTYTGKAIKPSVVVYYNKNKLTAGRDYTLTYQNNTQAAVSSVAKAPTVTVKGKGNYSGTKKKTFTINKAQLTEKDGLKAAQIYPKGIKYTPIVVTDGNILKAGTDYTLSYLDASGSKLKKQPTEVGNYQMQIIGKGNCEGEISFQYSISESGGAGMINNGTATVSNITYGSKEPEVTLSVDGKTLKQDIDYIVNFTNTNKKGTATATFIGIGNYTGTLKKNFKVQAASIQKNDISVAGTVAYEKGGAKAAVSVTVGGVELIAGTDYTVSYKNNTKVGNATVTVKGKGNYIGSQTKDFKVEPKSLAADGIKIFVSDVPSGKKPTVTVFDANGKKLSANSDYAMEINNATHQVTITGGKNGLYKAESPIVIMYRELEKDRQVTSVTLNKKASDLPKYFEYTGKEVELKKDWMTVKAGKITLKSDEFKVLGYVNNIEKGTATVIIQGIGAYGGIKMLNFKIKEKGLL